jgi:2,4'-dihydroxyacetophenone dioxygenase
MTTVYRFDERNTKWSPIEVPGYGLWSGFEFSPLAGSLDFKVVDFLIKFPPKQEAHGRVSNLIASHRHCGITHTFVINGEHHIYEPDGSPSGDTGGRQPHDWKTWGYPQGMRRTRGRYRSL